MFILPFHTKNFETKFLYMPSQIITTPQSSVAVPDAYNALLQSNPYRGLSYKKSPWQNFLSKLGFRTQADAWQENMQVQAQEFDSALQQKIYDEQYNEPDSQVQRMKAAGLNPDLDPSSIESSEASPMGEDPSTPMLSTGEEEIVSQVANGVAAAFSNAIGIFQGIQGVQRNRLDNLGAEFDLFGSLTPNFLPSSPNPDGIENFDWKAAALQNATQFAGNLPKKMQKRFIDYQERFWNSAIGESESYEDFKKRIASNKNYQMESRTFWSEIPSVLSDIFDPLADAAEKIYKKNQSAELKSLEASEMGSEASISGSQTEIAYQNELNGKLMAEAQNASNDAQANKDSTVSILQGTMREIVEKLKVNAEEGGIKGGLSSMALMGISGLYLWLSSVGMPSISRSQNSGMWQTDKGFGRSSGNSFSLGW